MVTILMRRKAVLALSFREPENGKIGFIPPAAQPPGTRGF